MCDLISKSNGSFTLYEKCNYHSNKGTAAAYMHKNTDVYRTTTVDAKHAFRNLSAKMMAILRINRSQIIQLLLHHRIMSGFGMSKRHILFL